MNHNERISKKICPSCGRDFGSTINCDDCNAEVIRQTKIFELRQTILKANLELELLES